MGLRRRSFAVVIAVGLCATAGSAAAAAAYVHNQRQPAGASSATKLTVQPAIGVAVGQPALAESVFVGVRSCLIGQTTTLSKGHHVDYAVAGTDLSGQGGSKTGCNIPASATSVVGHLQAQNVSKSGADSLSVPGKKPHGQTLFLSKGQPVSAGFTQPVSQGGGPAIRITATGTSEVSLWVNGYYTEQVHGLLLTGGTSEVSGSSAITGVTSPGAGIADLSVDRDVKNCTVLATSDGAGKYAFGYVNQATDHIVLETWVLNSTAQPVLTNGYVHFVVDC